MKSRCQCCDSVSEVTPARSRLKRGISWNLCPGCAENRHEPRFWLILFARTNGVRTVEKVINADAYCGNPILLKEVL